MDIAIKILDLQYLTLIGRSSKQYYIWNLFYNSKKHDFYVQSLKTSTLFIINSLMEGPRKNENKFKLTSYINNQMLEKIVYDSYELIGSEINNHGKQFYYNIYKEPDEIFKERSNRDGLMMTFIRDTEK